MIRLKAFVTMKWSEKHILDKKCFVARETALPIFLYGENIMNKPTINPYVAVFVGVIAVSFSSLFVKMSEAHSFIIAFYRLLLTFIILMPFSFKEKVIDIKESSFKDIALCSMSGVFLALHFILWFVSLKYTSIASSVVLVTTQPIFVVLGSILLFRERISLKAMIGGVIALIGSFLIGAGDFQYGGTAVLGDILAIVAAVSVSGYLIIGRIARSRVSLGAYTFLTYGSASITLGLIAFLTGKSFYPYAPTQWMLFLGLAVVCTIMGHTVFNWALKYIKASVIAVGILGEPVGAILWAAVFLGENPTLRQMFSGLIILTGLFIFTKASSTEENAASKN